MFRIFKSFNEYMSIRRMLIDIVWADDKLNIALNILGRVGFFFYWLFDNIVLLCSIKFLEGDKSYFNKLAGSAWFVGLCFDIARMTLEILNWMHLAQKDPSKKKEYHCKIAQHYVRLISKLGDCLVSANNAQILHTFLGKAPNEALICMGGLTSSLIALYFYWIK